MEKVFTLKDEAGNTFFTCQLIEANSILECVWIGDCNRIDCGKQAAAAIYESVRKYNIKKVMDDNRLGFGKWPDILDWLENHWKPELVQAGVKLYVHVLSPDTISKKTAHKIFNQTLGDATFITFDSYDLALNWLKG